MSQGVLIQMLGPTDVHLDGVELPVIKRRKVRALLAFLALAPRCAASREALAALLWGECDEAAARANLRQTLFLLRRYLERSGHRFVIADAESVSLRDVRTDVEAFVRLCAGRSVAELQAGLELYRGPFLGDLLVPEEPFELWQLGERARLDVLATDALERLAALHLRSSDLLEAVSTGRRLLKLDPARESAHRLIMRALARSGQRSAALEQYRSCRRILDEELGLEPDAETRRLLEEIRSDSVPRQSTESEGDTTPAPAVACRAAASIELERRQVSVMRCDLVGPAALSDGLEPERYRERLIGLQGAAVGALEQFSGHVAKQLEDGLLVYFGYPQAHEDDAERAVRAGLAVLDVLGALDEKQHATGARIGIATGIVVAGESLREAAGGKRVIGGAPLTAERLALGAAPDSVVVSATTAELLFGLFELEVVVGTGGEQGYRVVSSIPRRSRFAGRAAKVLSPLVGRVEELGTLIGRWAQVRTGRGRAELVIGEPGIGKSRLVHELVEHHLSQDNVLYLQCSPFHGGSALHPLIACFSDLLGFDALVEGEGRLVALRHHLGTSGETDPQAVGLIGHLLGVTTLGQFPGLEAMKAAERRDRTLRALIDYACNRAERAPLLCVFEDVHWADPTTSELLSRLVECVEIEPILVIATARPGFEAGWADLGHARTLTLSRLAGEASESLARVVASSSLEPLPAEVLSAVVARADGIPLFIEELIHSVIDRPLSPRAGSLAEVSIPLSLRDSLLERLDRLGDAKELAQVGALIGREFTLELVAAVLRRDQQWARDRLDRLIGARLVHRRGSPPAQSYMFKHALVQDAACDSLLSARRRDLHARILEAMSKSADVRPEPEVLARHCMAAELFDRAVEHTLEAAEKCVRSWSLSEAREHYWSALRVLAVHPEIEGCDRRRVEVAIALARHSDWASTPEHVVALEAAVQGAEQLGDDRLLAEACFGLARMLGGVGTYNGSLAALERCKQVAERSGHSGPAARAEAMIARRRYLTGDMARSLAEVPWIVEKLARSGESGEIPVTISTIGNFAGWLGRFETGFRWAHQAIRAARDAKDLSREAVSCLHLTMLHGTKGELPLALGYSKRAVELAGTVGDFFTASITTMLEGYYRYVLGSDPEGITLQIDAIEGHRLQGRQSMLGLHCAQLAECLALTGNLAEAEEFAHRSIERADAGETIGLSNAYLARALIAARACPVDFASTARCFTDAEDLARSRGERPLLAKIYFHRSVAEQEQGLVDSARASRRLAGSLFEEMGMQWWVDAVRDGIMWPPFFRACERGDSSIGIPHRPRGTLHQ